MPPGLLVPDHSRAGDSAPTSEKRGIYPIGYRNPDASDRTVRSRRRIVSWSAAPANWRGHLPRGDHRCRMRAPGEAAGPGQISRAAEEVCSSLGHLFHGGVTETPGAQPLYLNRAFSPQTEPELVTKSHRGGDETGPRMRLSESFRRGTLRPFLILPDLRDRAPQELIQTRCDR
jgi:hypothetical protein